MNSAHSQDLRIAISAALPVAFVIPLNLDCRALPTAFRRRRCLIIAAGFYEWRQGDIVPHYITLNLQEPMPFAGLWETWDGPDGLTDSCTLCTTEANDMMGRLHTRMPIILPHDSIDRWLNPQTQEVAQLKALRGSIPAKTWFRAGIGRS